MERKTPGPNWNVRASTLIDGTLKAMTLAVIDSEKDDDRGNDEHGSKVIVIPYNGKALAEFAKTDEYTPASTNRKGLAAQSDTHIQVLG